MFKSCLHANDVDIYSSADENRQVTTQKDLGIYISDDMKCNHQIETATKKAIMVIFMLKRTSVKLCAPTKLKSYQSMVLPVLNYGSTC